MKPVNPRLSTFTLIELLVVVAIIGILASMLLPALVMARDKAKVGSCLNQQKQLGMGLMLYADDSDEWGIESVDWGGNNTIMYANRGWIDSYFPVTRQDYSEMFVCPDTANKARASASYHPGRRIATRQYMSYMVAFGVSTHNDTSDLYGWHNYVATTATSQYRTPCPRLPMAGSPVKNNKPNYNTYYVGAPEDSGMVLDNWRIDNQWYGYGVGYVPNNHEGMDGVNVVFLDGHGAWRPISASLPRYKNYYVWHYW